MRAGETINRRVLVIDDDESARDGFSTVLAPRPLASDAVSAAALSLFGGAAVESPHPLGFEVDVAADGRQGVEMVTRAVASGRPYAVVFCDMRMPGWDGLETVRRIRERDRRAEIVFVTAYSDYEVRQIVHGAGADVGYFVKPFDAGELKQITTKAVVEWNRARELETLLELISRFRGESADGERLLAFVLGQTCEWLGTDSAALVEATKTGALQFRAGVGRLAAAAETLRVLDRLPRLEFDAPHRLDESAIVLPVPDFGLAVALAGAAAEAPEQLYLLRVFLQHAGTAIRNHDLQRRLLESERLGAVGQALAFVVHDMRNPLSTILLTLSLLERGAAGDSVPHRIEVAKRALHQCLDLVEDTLDFSRGSVRIEPRRAHLMNLVVDTCAPARARVEGRGGSMIVSCPADLEARVDGPRFARAVQNLVTNAERAIADGVSQVIEVGAARVDDAISVWVADNGPCIAPDVLARLFEPFGPGGKPGGTGFGLAIVKQIVEAHGGTVSVATGPDGTRFELTIPDARTTG
jgi:two-component system NtrC family sensor kinase